MRNQFTSVFLAGLSFLAAGCESGDSPGGGDDTFQVWDSAGIEIVESAAPAWGDDGWTVSDSPGVAIGRMEGDERYLFGSVAGATVLRDGRIAVLDGQSALIRVYSAEGDHIEDWGGQGEGPGEFRYPWYIFPYRGDSILVGEIGAMSLTVLDAGGQFGRRLVPEMQMSFATDFRRRMEEGDRSVVPAESCCNLWGAFGTGAFLLSYPEMIPNTGTGTKRGTLSAAITPDSGGAPEPAGDFEGSTYSLGLDGERTGFQFPPWFNMAAGRDGYYATEGDEYSIDEYDVSGRLRRIVRLAREPGPVTDEVRAAHEQRLRDWILAPDTRVHGTPEETLERMLAEPYPSHLPTFVQLLTDSEGNLWARQERYGAANDIDEYFVFGSEGRHLGVIELPANFRVFQIGADFILGSVRDELDVQYVHLYGIEK